tara:strand:+ start:5583 stop:6146 length:564 start_codon:yes stop_codon:yes gene_type:complete
MIEKLGLLTYHTFTSGGGGFGAIIDTFERIGVFQYFLPFLIIFSLVFLTLNGIKIFKENRAISAIIAISIGFMAMSFDFVPLFFQELFPRLGVGLGVIIGLLVLTGLFLPDNALANYALLALGVIIAIFVFFSTAGQLNLGFSNAWDHLSSEFIAYAALLIMIVVIVAATSTKKPEKPIISLHQPAS